jgi:predicted SAM-dependent methyltransferase
MVMRLTAPGLERGAVPGSKDPIRLNLGCGLQAPPGWVNVDGSWNARLAKYPLLRRVLSKCRLLPEDKLEIPWSASILILDIRKPLPFLGGSVAAIYASHVLEHLYREEGQRLIAESYRVLTTGGFLRIVVPDLRAIVEEYLRNGPLKVEESGSESLRPADRMNERLLMRWPTPASSHLLYRIYSSWQDFHSHKWMYDADSLMALFKRAGFAEVEKRGCHDSRIAGIHEVEDPSRILDGAGVCVEGMKPGPP